MNIEERKYFENFGYKYFGPLLLGFSKWLIEDLKIKKIDRVYFLSRDGYLIKRAFDVVNDGTISSYYFYASRRAIIVPYLWKIKSREEIFKYIVFNKKFSVKTFLKKVGLEDYDLSNELNKYGYKINDIQYKDNLGKFENFIEEIMPIIKNNSKKEWNNLQKYSKKSDFKNKIAIVDIGWNGSMQRALQNLFVDKKFFGYYFGLVSTNIVQGLNIKGYIFDKKVNEIYYNKMHYFINIFEFLFLAQHGSVKRYIDDKSDVELYKYEYENREEKNIAKIIQDYAIKFVQDNKYEDIDDKKVINKFINYFLKPSYKSAKLFGNIKFYDDEFNYIAKPDKGLKYILHPKKFINDFKQSSWRIGFLKRLLIIPFPYYYLNNLIRKIYFKKEK